MITLKRSFRLIREAAQKAMAANVIRHGAVAL
jgi:hypothetical protein